MRLEDIKTANDAVRYFTDIDDEHPEVFVEWLEKNTDEDILDEFLNEWGEEFDDREVLTAIKRLRAEFMASWISTEGKR